MNKQKSMNGVDGITPECGETYFAWKKKFPWPLIRQPLILLCLPFSNHWKIAVVAFVTAIFHMTQVDAATVTLVQQTGNYNASFSDGGGAYNSGSTNMGMWANTGSTKHSVRWRNFRTEGGSGGSNRSLQIGDEFEITVRATRAFGQIGLSLNAGGTQGSSWANRRSGSRLHINSDNYGSWFINHGGGDSSYSYNPSQNTYRDYTFTVRITSETTADSFLSVNGSFHSRQYNLTMNGSAGVNINAYSVYVADDWDGGAHRDIFWRQTTYVQDTGVVQLGYFLTSGTYTPGRVRDGLAADSTSTTRANDVFIGGDSGTIVALNNDNDFTGEVTVNADATARAGHNNAFGTTAGGVTVLNGGRIELNDGISIGSETLTLNGSGISASGSLRSRTDATASWAGPITLGNNSVRIMASSGGSLTLSGNITGDTQPLVVGGSGNVNISGAIQTTTGSLTKDGSGTLTLSGNNTYSGNTDIEAGNVTVNSGGTLGSGSDVRISSGASLTANTSIAVKNLRERGSGNSGTASIGSGAVLTIDGHDNGLTYMHEISGDGGLAMAGSGTTVTRLFGNNTYSGNTFVYSAKLGLHGGSGNIASPIIFIGTNATFSVESRTGGWTLSSGQDFTILAAGDANPATIETASGANLTAASDSTLVIANYNSANGAPLQVTGDGALNLASGNAVIVTNLGSALTAGSYKLIAKVGSASVGGTVPASVTVAGNGLASVHAAELAITSGELFLVVTSTRPTDATWDGGGANDNTLTEENWVGDLYPESGASSIMRFAGSTRTTPNVNYAANSAFASIIFNSGASAFTIDGNAMNIHAGITNLSSNTQTINNNLTISAATEVNAASGNIDLAGSLSGSAALSKLGSNALTLSGDNSSHSGGVSQNASGGTLNINHNNALGSGAYSIASGNTFDNTSGGTRTIGNNVNVNAATTFGGSNPLIVNGEVNLGGANRTITVSGSTLTINGQVTQTSGSRVLTKAGAGTLTLNGNNNHGGVTITGGSLNIGHASAIGTGTFTPGANVYDNTSGGALTITNDVSWNGNSTFTGTDNLTISGSTTLTANRTLTVSANNLTLSGVLGESGGARLLTKGGSGTLTLSGNNTHSGGTTISDGQLNIDHNNALGSGTFTTGAGTFDNTSGGSITAANDYTVSGNPTFVGSNPLTLSGTGTLTANRTVTVSANTLTLSGVVTESGGTRTLTKQGAGTLVLGQNNTYNGATTISAGTLQIGAGGTSGSVAANIVNNSALIFNRSDSFTYDGVISGSGTLTKEGAGTLTLGGNSSFSGNSIINAGAIRITHGSALGNTTGSNNVANGAAFEIIGGISSSERMGVSGTGLSAGGVIRSISGANTLSGAINLGANSSVGVDADTLTMSGIISGAHSLTKVGPGILGVSAANTFNGGLNVLNGTVLSTGNAASLGAGTVTVGDTSGSANVELAFSGSARTHANNVTVVSGSSGTALISHSGNTSVSLSGTVTFNRAITLSAVGGGSSFLNFSGGLAGSGAVTVDTDPGTINFSADNSSFTGAVTVDTGTLRLSNVSALSANNAVTMVAGSTIDVYFDNTIASLAGVGTVTANGAANRTLTVSPSAGSTTFSGAINDGSRVLSLTKDGAGTQILTGASTHSGNTTVSAGTLVQNGTNTSSAVSVNSGATLMGGGAVGGLTVTGTVRPGNDASTIGRLNVSSLTMNNGSALRIKLGDVTNLSDRDFINNSGSATINATSTIFIDDSTISNWDNTQSYSWNIIVGGISSAANFALDETHFSSAKGGGTFSLSESGGNLVLSFTPAAGEPTVQATDITFSSVGVTSMTVSWTDGNGASRIVVAREGSAVDANPSDSTSYSANTSFGSGAEIGTGNFVVYNGSGSSVAVSGLSANTVYHFRVYEYNGSGGSEDYLTSTATGNPASRTTLATEPTTQATTVIFSSVGTTSMTVGWTSGNGANRLVIARQGSAPSGGPVDGTSYTADDNFGGSGSALGDGEVVYQGSGSSFTLTGLSPATRYYLQVYEYNGSGLSLNYNTDSATGNPGNRYTLSNEPSDHATSFTATTASSSQINLTWTAASGPPSGYIVLQRTSADPTGTPTDGQGYSVSDTIGDGTVAAIVTPGSATSVNITGLSAGTAYHFSIVPFNWDGANAQTYYYRTAATIPTANATTYADEPTTQATDITFPTRTQSSIQVNWTSGNGANRVVVAREGSAVDANPVDGTGYTANSVFGSGSALGSGFVIYNGSGDSVTVTGLKTNTTYHFRVYEFNGSAGTANYNTNSASGNPASESTLDDQPGIGVGGGINVTTMVGSSPSAGSFVVTNIGGSLLSYVVSDDVGWLSVAPLTATNKSNGQTESHTITYTVTGLSGGVSNATITVTGTGAGVNEPTNSPQTIAVALTLTNIPAPQSIAAEVAGPEFVRVRAAEAAGRTIMIVHRQTNAPAQPVQGTPYSLGDDIGGGSRVLFRFTGSSTVSNLEHVVQAGSTNFYAFYAINNDHYSPVELIGATTDVYAAGSIVETFSYTNLQTMASKSGGFGWTNNWSVAPGTNDFTVTTQLFTQITGYPVGGGNSLTGRGSRILRDFTAITNGKIYASFHLRIDNGGNNQFSGLSFFNNDSEVKFFGEGFSQVNQLTVGGSTGPSGRQLANNTDYTIIAMYDFGASEFRAVLYTNVSESIPAVEPSSWHVTEAGSASRINRIRLASNIGSQWDEVRIATNYYQLLAIEPPGPGIAVGPATVDITVMKGNASSGNFAVTNIGGATLLYTNYITYGSVSGWLSVAPANASVEGAASQINTGTVSSAALAAGVYVATNRVDGNQTNDAAEIVYTLTVTNIPDATSVTPVVDGKEMVRIEWVTAGYDVLILHRDGEAPSANPTDNTAYVRDDAIGGGTVIYIGSNQRHEHIVPPGSTNYYRVYSINNDHYSPGVLVVGTTDVYRVGEIVEPFAYTNNASLGSAHAGGQGWSGGWTTNTGVWIVRTNGGPVNFTIKQNVPTNAANRIRLNNPGNGGIGRAVRELDVPVTNGQIYVAAHMSYQFQGANKWMGINFMSNGVAKAFFGEVAHDNRKLGLSGFGSTNVTASYDFNDYNTSTNNTYYVIGAYDFDTRVLKVAAFYRTTVVPLNEPEVWDAYGTVPAGHFDRIDAIRLYAGSSDGAATVGDVYYDEIRVASSWDELLNKPPTYEWDAGGGSNRDWSYAPNWTANTEPIAISNAFINGNYTGVVSQVGEVAYDLFVGSAGTGTLLQTGGNLTVTNFILGRDAGSWGTYQISSGYLGVSNTLFVGDDGRGEFVIDGNADVVVNGGIQISDSSANNQGLITHNSGTLTVNNILRLGRLSATDGRYMMTGGVLVVNSDIYMGDGNANSTGRLDVSGGRIDVANIIVGRNGLGLMTVSGSATVNVIGANSDIVIGDLSGNNNTNRLTIQGGVVNVADNIELGDANGTFGNMYMDGGVLTVTGQVYIGDASGSTGEVTIAGGDVNILGVGGVGLIIGNSGLGRMYFNGGNMLVDDIQVGAVAGSYGYMTITNGTISSTDHLVVGNATGEGVLHIVGDASTITIGDGTTEDFTMDSANAELRLTFANSAITPILVQDDITVAGTLTVSNIGAVVDGAYVVATSLNESAISGTFAVTNWLGDYAGTVSYDNNRILITFVTEQEIAILGTNLAEIASGHTTPSLADGTDFGSVNILSDTLTHTFYITNSGGQNLTISGVTTSGTGAAEFEVLDWPTIVSPLSVSNLIIRFDPAENGLRTAVITVSNNDADEGTYTFTVQGTGLAPGIHQSPDTINLTTMKGVNPASSNFGVTNVGTGILNYDISTNQFWLTVSPVSGSLANGEGQSHSISYNIAGFAAGVSNAIVTITSASATNSPREVAVSITITNIPEPTAAVATNDGPEMMRLSWTAAGYDVFVVHRDGQAPSADPADNTSYGVGTALGGGTVIYSGSGSALEHIVAPGSTNYYRFYSVNNNHYSPGLQRIWTTSVYRVEEIVDQFAYTNTVPLHGLGGGQGWTNSWDVTAPHAPVDAVVAGDDLLGSYLNDWPPERANRMVLKTTNTATYIARRNFTGITTGKVYVAAMYRRAFNEGATDGKFSGIRIMQGDTEQAFVGERGGSGNDDIFGVSSSGGATYGAANSFPAAVNYLIIGRFDLDSGIMAGIYYTTNQTIPNIEPDFFVQVTNAAVTLIDGISLVSGSTNGFNGDTHFDDIRVAQSWYELLGVTPPDDPALDVDPLTINLAVMKGSTTSATFTVENLGGLPLLYTNYVAYGPGASGWLTVAPANASVASAASQINTGSVAAAGIAVGVYTATNRVDGNQTNDAQFVSFNLTITNIPPVTAPSATADGAEMVRLSWSSPRDVMVVYREGSAPSADPVDNTSYGIGAALGGGTVTYKGSAQELEHTGLANGETHYYRIYAMNNNHYSAGEQVTATTDSYPAGEIIEPFSYTNDVSLASRNGGQGWSGGWTISSGTWVVRPSTASNNMTDIPNYPPETGNKIRLADPGSGGSGAAYREFPLINTGVVYVATMMSYEFRGTNKYAGLSFLSNGNERAYFGKIYAPQQLFGINSHGNPAVESAFEILPFAGSMGDSNNVYLIVAKYNFDTREMRAKAFHRTTEVPIVEPDNSSWDAMDTLPVGRMNGVNGIRLGAGAGTGAGTVGRVDFDEVRVATSWANLMRLTGAPYATNYNIGNSTNYVSDGQVRAGTFPVVMALRSEAGVETTNTIGSYFIPNFDLITPAGIEIVTNHNFATFAYQDSGRTVIASNNTHSSVSSSAITLGVYTSRWSAISSNALATINVATLSNETAITFTVFDDDVAAPEIATISSTNNSANRNLHISLGPNQISTGSGSSTNILYTTTDGALVGIAATNPLIFWLGAYDSGSGLQRGNDTASTNSSLTIGSAIISNVFHWDATRSSGYGRTFTNSATNSWSWIVPLQAEELDNLVTNTAFGLGTNRITATWWDADSDRANDQSVLINQQHGWLVVNDDDITPPSIYNFLIRGSTGISTVTVAELLSGANWGITGRVSDASGINVNGTSTTQPDISPYFELWDHNGVMRLRQVFNTIPFSNGGATATNTAIWSTNNNVLAVASAGIWTARVVVADADSDRPNDRIIATNTFPFEVIIGDSQAGMGVSVSSLNVTSTFGVVAGGGTWPNFTVTNFGISVLAYDATISYNSGFGWLQVSPSTSVSIATASSVTHTVSVNTDSLNPGTYSAVIALSGNQTNGTQYVTNHLTVIGYNVGEIVDQFTNTVSSSLNGSNGGTGWTNAWSADPSGSFTVTSGNLTVPGNYPAVSGHKVCGDSSSEIRAFRYFPVFNTGKVFMAVAAQQSSGSSAGYYGISFMSNSTEVAYAGKLFGDGNFGLDLSGNGGQQSAGFGVTGMDPYFFVGMYDFDTATFYGRAYFGGTLPLTEPTWTATLSPTTPIGSINGVRIAAGNQGTVCFDEIRVARSWESLLNQFTDEPTLHAVNMTFTNVMTNAMTVNWNSGNGLARIVVARQGSPVSFTPVDGVSYTADNNFATATDLGSGNKIIYNGSGSSVPVIGLDIATRYYYAVFEYNGSGASSDYLTNGTFLTGNRWTLSTEPVEPATDLNAYTVSDTQMSNTWTQAGGSPAPDGYLIARRNGAAVTFVPQDGVGYTNGQVVPDARVFVVTPGSAEYFLHENLTPCVTYHFAIYPFRWNGSAADTYNYYTNTPATASEVTTCEEPLVQASNIVFSAIGTNRITLTWERGSGERSMVVVRGTNAVNENPVDGQTYTANTVFGSGSHLGNGNFVVYRGTGNTVTVTGLAPGVTYHFRIYEFNGSGGGSDYITTTANNNPRSTATASFGIVEDKFDYSPGWDNLFGKNGGTGWTNSWFTIDGLVEVGDFNMPAFGGYPVDSGTRAGFMNSVTRRSAYRGFPGRNSGQLFLAIKINVGDTQTAGYFGVNLLNGAAPGSNPTGFVGKANNVANNRLSLEHNGVVRTNRLSGSNSGYTLNSGPGNDYLMVMMYDFDTREFRARAYTPGQVAHADPTKENAWDVQMDNVIIDRIDGIEIVGSNMGNCAFDHIRIGPSWEEVMWNLPDGWHEEQGPVPTLVYIGTNYNSAFHSQVITNLSDAELRSASLIDFAIRWDTPNGMFLTNNTATNRNIGSPNARVTPNWDPLAIGAATNQFGLDRYFTNFFGFNNASVVTTYQYSAFNITNIDFEIQYFVTVSAESAPAGAGTINAPNGSSWAAIPTNRGITINHPLRFYVYDDDPEPPVRGEGGMVVMSEEETVGFQNLDENRRRFFITDAELAANGMDISIKAYDEYSRLQRAEGGDPSTNINITIPGLVTSNTSYFVYDRSTPTANTTNLLTSNLWSFSSSMFDFNTISDLWGGDGTTLQGQDLPVRAMVPDNDEDRVNDQAFLEDELFGFIRIIDNDTEPPAIGTNGLTIIAGDAVITSGVTTDLLAGWNFNDTGNRKVVNHGSGTMTDNLASTNNNTGSSINLVGSDVAGQDITIQGAGNTGRYIQFTISMQYYQNLVMTFAAQRSGTGYDDNTISYSINGGGFVSFETGWNPNTSFALKTVDFGSVTEINNAETVTIRITLGGGTGGNNRFDNIQFNASPITFFEITDNQLANVTGANPLRFSFNVYDTISGIARNVAGTSNMHVSINGMATNNTANFMDTFSSADTTVSSATSVWSFTSFGYNQIGELYANGMSNRPIFASVSDADFNRQNDNLWVSNSFFGLYRVIDQDTNAPVLNTVNLPGADPAQFVVVTNGTAPGDLIRNSITRRSGDVTTVSDADLANSGSRNLQFVFGARDVHTGVSRGTSGTTNDVMSFSIGAHISGNFENYSDALSTPHAATNRVLTNYWTFANGFFDGDLINDLMASSTGNAVRVTLPDLDDDRPNDRSVAFSQYVGTLRVVDDDIKGPTIASVAVAEAFDSDQVFFDSFDPATGWTNTLILGGSWTNLTSNGVWSASGNVSHTIATPILSGTRRIGLLTNAAQTTSWLQFPPIEEPGLLTLFAGRFSGDDVTIRMEWLDEDTWTGLGDLVVTNTNPEFDMYTWNINLDGVVTLRLVRVTTTGPQVYVEDVNILPVATWLSTNQLDISWSAAFDDFSGVDEYRVVVPAVGASLPAATNDGLQRAFGVTNDNFSIQGHQGVLTGFVFSIDGDNDRANDRAMGNIKPIIVRIDTNPPPQASSLRASDAANDILFDPSIDETSEIKIEWTPPGSTEAQAAGWRQSDNAALSPWDSYLVTYYEVVDETGVPIAGSITSTISRADSSWSNVLNNFAFTNLVLSNLNFDAYYLISIQGRDEAGNIGLATNVIGNTDRFVVTQGISRVALDLEVRWKGVDGRDYDVLYVDPANGFSTALSNQWALMQYTNRPVMFDTGGVARLRPGELTNTTYRFYRVARTGRWSTNLVTRSGSVEIYVTKALNLFPGENWHSLFFVPDTATVSYVFQTNLLPAADNFADATKITWFGPNAGGTTNQQGVATAVIWLASSPGTTNWVWHTGGAGSADEKLVPLDEAFLLELPTSADPQSLVLIGQLPTNQMVQVIPGGNAQTNTHRFLSHHLPVRTPLSAMGFIGSGLVGNNNGSLADEIRILSAGGSGSLQSPKARIRLRSDQTTWAYYAPTPVGGPANPSQFIIEPDDAVIIVRRNAGDMFWTNSVNFMLPTKNFTP